MSAKLGSLTHRWSLTLKTGEVFRNGVKLIAKCTNKRQTTNGKLQLDFVEKEINTRLLKNFEAFISTAFLSFSIENGW